VEKWPAVSAYQCVDELCFQKDGALVSEFHRMFASLFHDADTYIKLIRVIAKHPCGIGQALLIKKSGTSSGGQTVTKLKALTTAGFILEFVPYGHQEKGISYKIVDEFTLFYLRWMESKLKSIIRQGQSKGYWLAKTQSPSWRSWAGYAFESICYKHLPQIRTALSIDLGAETGSWRYSPRLKDQKGTQIDLLFDRNDGSITLCEIKYNNKPFSIDKRYSTTLLDKIKIYQQQSRTTKQIFLSMVTVAGIKPSIYSKSLVNDITTLDDLFIDL